MDKSGDIIHNKVMIVRNAVAKMIRRVSLERRIQFLRLLQVELKYLTRSNQSQLSRQRAKSRPASLSR